MYSTKSSSASLCLVLAVLMGLLCSTAVEGITRQKSCRSCDCDITLTGEINADALTQGDATMDAKDFMQKLCDKATGGDGGTFLSRPHLAPSKNTPGAWEGRAHFYRLCGNGKEVTHTWDITQWNNRPTHAQLSCQCNNSVVCLKGSKCQDSGI